jgi:methylated-DNA-[protein]-cysteine S-methyltransferase
MEVTGGSCRFGLWFVNVWWAGDKVFSVCFSKTELHGQVPHEFIRYCAGKEEDFQSLESVAITYPTIFGNIYRELIRVPYGKTVTYSDIAGQLGTSPRVVGQAMKKNPTPLVIPCHRVIAKHGMGGYTPDPVIKEELLLMEKKTRFRKN